MESEQAPAGVELHDPTIEVLVEPEIAPPFELRRPRAQRAAADAPRPRGGRRCVTPRAAPRSRIAAASVAGFRVDAGCRRVRRDAHTEDRRGGDRERRERVSRSTGSGGLRSSRRARSSTSRSWSACSSACTRSGPVFRAEPHDTVRHLAEYVSLDAEMGFITDHHDVMRVLRDVARGDGRGDARASGAAIDAARARVADGPAARSRSVDFTEAQAMIERADRRGDPRRARPRPRARALARGVGACASTAPTSSS